MFSSVGRKCGREGRGGSDRTTSEEAEFHDDEQHPVIQMSMHGLPRYN